MTWLKIDDTFPDHPKVDGLSDGAFRLHVSALCHAARYLTDGFVEEARLPRLVPRFDPLYVDELVAAELWHRHDDESLLELHDFLDYNPTRAKVEADRKAEREKKARQRAKGSSSVQKGADGRFRSMSRRESPGDNRRDSRGESPATRPVPSRPLSSSSPPPSDPTLRALEPEEEEERSKLVAGVTLEAVELVAERVLARRAPDAPPIVNRAAWIRTTAEARLDQHEERIAELIGANPEISAFELADELEPDLAPPASSTFDPSCELCSGSTWIVTADGARPCPRCRP